MSEKPVWHASGGRKTKGTFNKFIPMLMSTPNVGNSSTWRPSWLKNLEQDIAIDRKLDVYVMARGGEIQLGRSPGKKSPKNKDQHTPKSNSPKPKWTPKWLWNNHGVEKHSFQREVRSEQDIKEAYESWKSKIEQKAKAEKEAILVEQAKKVEEERNRFSKIITKNISYIEFCEKAKKAKVKEKNRLKTAQETMEKEWEEMLKEKRKQVKLMKIKNANFREIQKSRVKHGPPGSRKAIKIKKKPKYFAREKSSNSKSAPIISVLNPPTKDNNRHHSKKQQQKSSPKGRKRNRLSQDDIAALYRLSVSPLVNPPRRHGNWQAIRPTSAPKGMPRFLTRLENTTDAPLDMRKPIKKALKRASSALNIQMTPPRYPAPRLRRKNKDSSLSKKAVFNPNPNTRPNTTPSNIDADGNNETLRPSTSDPKMYSSLEGKHINNYNDNINEGNGITDYVEETENEKIAREERYRLRRLAEEKAEQERLLIREAARAKAAERMRLVKEKDALEKAKEEEEQRKKEEEEIAKRLKANEEKMARRKLAFDEAQEKIRLEEKRIEKKQMEAAQHIQRIGRGKLARKRVNKIKNDRKNDDAEVENETQTTNAESTVNEVDATAIAVVSITNIDKDNEIENKTTATLELDEVNSDTTNNNLVEQQLKEGIFNDGTGNVATEVDSVKKGEEDTSDISLMAE